MHPPHGIEVGPPGRSGGSSDRDGGNGCGRVWLIAGTGEGPPLAQRLLASGWRLKVSVVSRAAALAYGAHPNQELAVGAIGGPQGPEAGIATALGEARRRGEPYTWVIDATHPFAIRISAALAHTCAALGQPLLRLQRPDLNAAGALVLGDLASLGAHCRPGERLLLAIGARRLGDAVVAAPAALHHARLLPHGEALALALAAGLAPERLAPLRPSSDGRVERALCRHWGIEAVLCRRSGGANEAQWHRICADLGLRLLLLERPPEPGQAQALPLQELLQRLGQSGPHA
ncbi:MULTISPECIES: precorrin-6A/cobalt-precorrin-6A reductase [unclassified Cyanobium]|uniref:precorrin-6A/cobalt-precorrin-6A reductase n=1 Tax=unclassified Cyanobium TaxID=2627006 RepID=UPI0020CFC4EC|nr:MULTISPECIES: precorrin-6A/cobalt-precorrin-6A reductase [unclassified Cyanobium]MCP9858055.1 precorrin-6A/cobalt-precorrin-6A reductase [Cyanobium sp. Cruz-8H5]MCP9865330.1 precorrin-6A/cobalt-precorrin-6A reductase [Cyanobium sp. Cruz-8D1]